MVEPILGGLDRRARVVANATRIETIEQMVRGINYELFDETDCWGDEVMFFEAESMDSPPAVGPHKHGKLADEMIPLLLANALLDEATGPDLFTCPDDEETTA